MRICSYLIRTLFELDEERLTKVANTVIKFLDGEYFKIGASIDT